MKLKLYPGQEIELPDHGTYFVGSTVKRYYDDHGEITMGERGTEITITYRITDTAY